MAGPLVAAGGGQSSSSKGYDNGFDAANEMIDNPSFSGSGSTAANRKIETETWVYEHDRALPFGDQSTATLVFTDPDSLGDFRLGQSPDANPTAIYKAAVEAAIAPGRVIVGAPQYQLPGESAVGAAVSNVSDGSLHTPGLVDIVARMRTATELPYNGVYLSWGEFVTSTGESFVPVQLYMTRLPTLSARPATFFVTALIRTEPRSHPMSDPSSSMSPARLWSPTPL